MKGFIPANRARLATVLTTGLLCLFVAGCQTDSTKKLNDTAIRYAESDNTGYDAAGYTGQDGEMVHLASYDYESLAQADAGAAGTVDQSNADNALIGANKWDLFISDAWALPGVAWEDAQTVVLKPTNLVILGVAGGLSIWGEFDFDERVDDHLRGREVINHDWTIAVGASGNPATHFGVAAAIYAHGLLSENSETYGFGKTLTQALVLTGATTVVLKLAAWNHVPNGELFGWPSGHTSSTITVASVVHEYYGLLPAAPLYALTGLVMYERMITGEHWASDVIFGAALGYVIGHSVAGNRQVKIMGMDVIPYTNPERGSSGIALVKIW